LQTDRCQSILVTRSTSRWPNDNFALFIFSALFSLHFCFSLLANNGLRAAFKIVFSQQCFVFSIFCTGLFILANGFYSYAQYLMYFFGYISRRAQQKTTGGVILYRNLFLECHYLASLSHMYTQKNIVINMLLSAIQSC